MRLPALFIAASLLISCGSAPPPPAAPHDATADPWYAETVSQLTALVRGAEALERQGKADDAAALIEKAEPLESRLLSVHQPTLAATEAAADLDNLYGRMLLSNRHYEWARFMFQKNLARWKHWTPPSPETEARLKQAQDAIAECDRAEMKK